MSWQVGNVNDSHLNINYRIQHRKLTDKPHELNHTQRMIDQSGNIMLQYRLVIITFNSKKVMDGLDFQLLVSGVVGIEWEMQVYYLIVIYVGRKQIELSPFDFHLNNANALPTENDLHAIMSRSIVVHGKNIN